MATGIIASATADPTVQPLPDPNATNPQIIQNNPTPPVSTTQPAGYTPTQVATPTPWTVTPEQTVSGQVQNLIAQDSPIIEQARTSAKQAANARGLLNSDLAVSAGEDAAYRAALPIASQDAQTYGKAAGYNADTQNQANTQNAQFSNAASQFNAKAINDVGLQEIANQNQVLIQGNSQAANLMNQATAAINNITNNPQMSAAAKTEASRQVYENLRTQLSILGSTSSLDLTSLLGTNPYPDNATFQQQQGAATIAGSGLSPAELQQMFQFYQTSTTPAATGNFAPPQTTVTPAFTG